MAVSFVKVERPKPHVAVVTLDRPDRYNALSYAMIRDLARELDGLMTDLDSRVVILTGSGKGFCAGADLKAGATGENGLWEKGLGNIQEKYRMQQAYGDLILKLRRLPQPVIAAINGPAAGGGFSLALACDLRICTPGTKFNCAYTRLGIGGAEMASSYFLPKLIGPALASELMYTGRFVDADEALRIGLVSRIIEDSELLDSAHELASEMVRHASPFGLRITKEAINLVQGGLSLEEAVHIENRNQVLALQTQDFMTAVASWMQKKEPEFKDW